MPFSPGIGVTAALAPVAMRQRSKTTSRVLPSESATDSVSPFLNRASPRSTEIAGLLSRMPSYLARRRSSTRPCCCASSAARSITGGLVVIPASNGLSRRRCATCAARIMILEGTQPTLTQVPPSVPRSISVTRAPCSTAFSAAAIAAPPLPMTAICNERPSPLSSRVAPLLNELLPIEGDEPLSREAR